MLKMVAPEASYEQISDQICKITIFWLGENLGGTCSQPKNFFKFELNLIDFPGSGILEACLGGLWGISGGLLEVSEKSLGGFWEVSGRFLGGLWEVSEGEGSPGGCRRSWTQKVMPFSSKMPKSSQRF